MKTYIKLEKNNGTTFYGFQFSKGNLVFLGKFETVSNFLEEELFTVDVGSIFNKNWYTYIEHNFDITISLYIPKAFHQENILISYLAHVGILLHIIETKDSLLATEFFSRKSSILCCFPKSTAKILEPISVEGLFAWLYGRFCDDSLFTNVFYGLPLTKHQEVAAATDTACFFYKAAKNRLEKGKQNKQESPKEMFIRYFSNNKNTVFTIGVVGQRYENWTHTGLDYIDSLFENKNPENFIAHKSRIEKTRKEFFDETTAYIQAEPYNIHDENALGLYLNDVKSYITGDEGMCLAGYLRKTGAEIIRASRPHDFRLKAKLVRIGNLQEGKTGIVVKVAV
jgi:hypothetical protein